MRVRLTALIVLCAVLASLTAALAWAAGRVPSSRPPAPPARPIRPDCHPESVGEGSRGLPPLRSGAVGLTLHTITPDACSAADLAHLYKHKGDWRAYRYQIDQLNPGLNWGHLHQGERLTVPDYRAISPTAMSASYQQPGRRGGAEPAGQMTPPLPAVPAGSSRPSRTRGGGRLPPPR